MAKVTHPVRWEDCVGACRAQRDEPRARARGRWAGLTKRSRRRSRDSSRGCAWRCGQGTGRKVPCDRRSRGIGRAIAVALGGGARGGGGTLARGRGQQKGACRVRRGRLSPAIDVARRVDRRRVKRRRKHAVDSRRQRRIPASTGCSSGQGDEWRRTLDGIYGGFAFPRRRAPPPQGHGSGR